MIRILLGLWLEVTSFFDVIREYFLFQVYPRFLDMVFAVLENVELRWIVAPLIVIMVLNQIYFGRYKHEDLGYQSAFGNAVVLVFVSVNLLRYMYTTYGHTILYRIGTEPSYKMLFVTAVMLEALLLLIMDFLHKLPRKFAFVLSSTIFVNVIAFVAIIVVYTSIPIDDLTFATAAVLIFVLFVLFWFIKWLIPPSEEAKDYLELRRARRREQWAHVQLRIREVVEKTQERVSKLKRGPRPRKASNVPRHKP